MEPISKSALRIALGSTDPEVIRICHEISQTDKQLDDWVANFFKQGKATEDDYFRVLRVAENVAGLLADETKGFDVGELQEHLSALNAVLSSVTTFNENGSYSQSDPSVDPDGE